ncbi:hypothetical protein K438DRAFT_1992759 [Mycena galopus ATCC 62051]|nr:hypothetical protein K438DRAFT_1992759 [Mycena galopus ATCC 62051]
MLLRSITVPIENVTPILCDNNATRILAADQAFHAPSLSDSTTTAAAASPTAFPTPVVPKPVVLAPAIVQHVQLLRNRIPLIDDEDMPEQPMFHGDGRPKENAHDYKKNLMLKFVGKGLSDAEKIEALGLGMASGSPADGWFDEPAQKVHTTWAPMSVAFDTKWPKRAALHRVGQDAIEDLLAEKLEAGDIGKRVLHGGGEEFGHVVWVRKMGLFIGVVREKLPMIMQDLLGPGTVFADWAALEVAVVVIKRAAIVNAQAKEARLVKMAAVRNVCHVPTPQLPVPSSPSYHASNATSASTGNSAETFQERLIDLERNALVQHPNTDTGRSLYQQQVRDWNAQHQNHQPNELRPYPITPGTAPLDSRGECFNCALLGHMTDGCPNPSMPPLEKKWRQIANSIRNGARRALQAATQVHYVASPAPAPIQYVSPYHFDPNIYGYPWIPPYASHSDTPTYNTNDQGNGEGSSN